MAYSRLRDHITNIDRLRDLLSARNYLERHIEGLEADLSIVKVRLQQVNETIDNLKKEIVKEQDKQKIYDDPLLKNTKKEQQEA